MTFQHQPKIMNIMCIQNKVGSVMLFIIASVRVFQFGINNPDLSVWDVKIGQLF